MELWRCELSIWYYPPWIFWEKKTCTWERATGSKKDLLGFPWFTTSTHNISGIDENLPRFPILEFFEFMVDSACLQVGTIMLLEVSYGWTTELCGTAFTIVTRLFCGFRTQKKGWQIAAPEVNGTGPCQGVRMWYRKCHTLETYL